MIQRIQSLYLLCVAALLSFWLHLPLGRFLYEGNEYIFRLTGISSLNPDADKLMAKTWPLLILTILTIVIALVTIFFYKKRMIQIRLSVFNFILLVGLEGLWGYYMYQVKSALNVPANFSIIDVFPLVAAFFTFMALRRIARDEAIVRSMDRLR